MRPGFNVTTELKASSGRPGIAGDLPGDVYLGFPGVGGVTANASAEYVRIRQQPTYWARTRRWRRSPDRRGGGGAVARAAGGGRPGPPPPAPGPPTIQSGGLGGAPGAADCAIGRLD